MITANEARELAKRSDKEYERYFDSVVEDAIKRAIEFGSDEVRLYTTAMVGLDPFRVSRKLVQYGYRVNNSNIENGYIIARW